MLENSLSKQQVENVVDVLKQIEFWLAGPIRKELRDKTGSLALNWLLKNGFIKFEKWGDIYNQDEKKVFLTEKGKKLAGKQIEEIKKELNKRYCEE